MPLKVELKPGEKLIIGSSLITNDKHRTRLFIEGNAPILREKDILTPETADSPARRVYLSVQLMYLHGPEKKEELFEKYKQFSTDIKQAAPSMSGIVADIDNEILTGSLYKALRACKRLILYEQELLGHAKSGSGSISESGDPDRQPDGA